MRRVQIANIQCSALGFGCANLMGRVGPRQSLNALSIAFDGGVTLFDTARSYGWGESEAILGKFARGRRDKLTIVTKFGILPPQISTTKKILKPIVRTVIKFSKILKLNSLQSGIRSQISKNVSTDVKHGQFDLQTAKASVEASLRKLNTDYIDILLLHSPGLGDINQEDTLNYVESLVKQGKVRVAGVSSNPEAAKAYLQKYPFLHVAQFENNYLHNHIQWIKEHPKSSIITNAPFGGSSIVQQFIDDSQQKGIMLTRHDACQILLRKAFADNPRGVVLCGMHTKEHIDNNIKIASECLSTA